MGFRGFGIGGPKITVSRFSDFKVRGLSILRSRLWGLLWYVGIALPFESVHTSEPPTQKPQCLCLETPEAGTLTSEQSSVS